jgi:ArsR family transcriptional regulator, arsenate/arsenite/antimonite-responsive transcriptional repressor
MESNHAVKALGALAQSSRLAIFRLLVSRGPEGMTAGAIGERLDLPPATLSFHLKELHHAGLVIQRQDGRFVIYSADFDQIGALVAFLTENCCGGKACITTKPPAKQQRVAAPLRRSATTRA